MNIRRSIITAAGAAAIVGTGAFILPAAASARPATHTLGFTAETKGSAGLSSSTEAEQDTDVNSKGKVVGYDMLYLAFVSSTTAAINITVDVNGGMLYGTATLNSKGVVADAKVTGGTGKFKGATGTFTVKTLNKAGTRHAVTITYSTK
jgi:hypothetical protein